jgi:hypothetical protein
VTSVVRAPFTRFVEDTGYGEVSEEARGRGRQRAVGELLGCEYRMGRWMAAGMVIGRALAPRETRLVASTFTVYAFADALTLAYSAAQDGA